LHKEAVRISHFNASFGGFAAYRGIKGTARRG
jgi:hypothetical protein